MAMVPIREQSEHNPLQNKNLVDSTSQINNNITKKVLK